MHTAIFTSGAHSHSITLQDMLWLEPGPSLLRSSWFFFLLGFASLLAVRENGFSAGTAHCDGQKEAHLLWGGMGSSWLVASSSAVGVLLPFSFPLAGLLSVLSAAPSTAPCICVGRRQKREWKAWKKCSKYNHIISRVNASLPPCADSLPCSWKMWVVRMWKCDCCGVQRSPNRCTGWEDNWQSESGIKTDWDIVRCLQHKGELNDWAPLVPQLHRADLFAFWNRAPASVPASGGSSRGTADDYNSR